MTGDLRAVVDVNVLVSAARTPNGLCGQLLEAAMDRRWRPVVSATLFQELEDVLARPKFRDVLGQETADLTDLSDTKPPIETPTQFSRRLAEL